jgi:hypothetical protein
MQIYEEQSRVRVAITDDFQLDGIAVIIGMRYDAQETAIIHFTPEGYNSIERVPPMNQVEHPTFRIQHEFARALRDALNRYYGDTYDDRALRADYKDERSRVDRLISAIIDYGSRPRTGPPAIPTEGKERHA